MTEPHFVFEPLERRGLLFGLQGGQVATLLGGAVVAVFCLAAAPRPIGEVLAASCVITAGALALVIRGDRTIGGWMPVVAAWARRRIAGPALAPVPLAGSRPKPVGAGAWPGIEVVELPALPGQDVLGVVRDARYRTLTAVVPVQGVQFALLDLEEQLVHLDSWRAVLATFARPGTQLRRVQWLERSGPEAVDVSYTVQTHEAFVVLAVGHGHGGRDGASDALRREVRFLTGQLRNTELRPQPPLRADAIRQLIAPPERPERRGGWALASDEAWAALRVDGNWHATYWIAEWPRVDVGPDFLRPLLACNGRRSLSVVMEPVPAERAARLARSARTADLADEHLRTQAGFLSTARREREAEGAVRREAELADGHAEFRFSGYVTVTAADRTALAAACVETEQAAQASRLELVRLYGRQAEAYTWTMPVARGLR